MSKVDLKGWTKVGVIGVDAGLCWLGDPCYILHQEKPPKAIGKSWSDFVFTKLVKRLKKPPYEQSRDHVQLNYDLGHKGLGVVVSTGYGDGVYGVYVRYVDDNLFGRKSKRIAEVKVVFIGDEED